MPQDIFSPHNILLLRRTIVNYQARLQEETSMIDSANSDQYNDLMAELQYFSNLTAEMLATPGQMVAPVMAVKLKASLDALQYRSDQYIEAKKDSYMGFFRKTRKRRFDLTQRLSGFLTQLKEKGISEETVNRMPTEQSRFIHVENETLAQTMKRTGEELRNYLSEVDPRSPFSFCGSDSDVHRLAFLRQMSQQLNENLISYQIEQNAAPHAPGYDVAKDPTVLKLQAQSLLVQSGLALRQAMTALAAQPANRQLQSQRDLCMIRLFFMMAYAQKVGWDKMDPQQLGRIARASMTDLRREVKNPSLDLLFDPPDRPGKDQIIKYRLQGMSSGRLMEEMQFSYDGKKYQCSVPMSRETRLKSTLELNPIKQMLESYDRSVDYWLTYAGSLQDEVQSHRAFVMAHRAELDRIYAILHPTGKLTPEEQTKLSALLGEKHLDQLMSDYCCLTGKPALDPVCQLLGLHKPENQSDFADMMRDAAIPQPTDPDYADHEAELDLTGRLSEFHKWMYRNSESAAGGGRELFGGEGSARAFVEEFLRQDPMIQLKTLYVMEHKLRRSDVSRLKDEDVRSYIPNLAKLKDEMVTSKFFFWKRLSGNKHRWDKLRDCLKNVRDSEIGSHLESVLSESKTQLLKQPRAINGLMKNITDGVKGSAFTVNKHLGEAFNLPLFGGVFLIGSDIPQIWQGLKDGDATAVFMGSGNAITDTVFAASGTLDIVGGALKNTSNASKMAVGAKLCSIAEVAGVVGDTVYFTIAGIDLLMSMDKKTYLEETEKIMGKVDPDKLNQFSDEQKELFNKLTQHTRTAKINNSYETKKKVMSFAESTAWLLCDIAALSVAAPWIAVAATATVPIYLVVNNKINANENRKVVDSELYKNDTDKQKQLYELQENLENRFSLKGRKFRDAFRKKFGDLKNNMGKLASVLREKVMAKSGFVNLTEFKNYLVNRIGDDVYDKLNKLKESEFRIYNEKTGQQKDYKTENLSVEEMKTVYENSGKDAKIFRAYTEEACRNLFKGLGQKYQSMEQRAKEVRAQEQAHQRSVQLAHDQQQLPEQNPQIHID